VAISSSDSSLHEPKAKNHVTIDWVKVLHPIQHKIGHFGDVLPSQSLGIALKKLNLTQQKHTHTNYNTK